MSHEQIDARSLEAHELMARRIERDPSLRRIALATLNRWMERRNASALYLERWRALIEGDLEELLATMRSRSEAAAALRQNTPFGGPDFISNAERFKLIRKYAALRA